VLVHEELVQAKISLPPQMAANETQNQSQSVRESAFEDEKRLIVDTDTEY
jgi:hypothetical protein